jgi:heavy metal translocating P-type ATPase
MLNLSQKNSTPPPTQKPVPKENKQAHTIQARFQSLWQSVKPYPLPLTVAILLLISLFFWLFGLHTITSWILLATLVMGGIPLLWETLQQFWHKEFTIDIIAILAIAGSIWLGEYLAGTFVVLMLSGGEALEAYALRRARTSLSALADRAPRLAHIWEEATLIDIPAEKVEIGMTIVVKPGELVPVDGVVEEGSSSVSEADLTGEPVPVRKAAGAVIFSGSVNLDGVLEIQASKRSAESKYAQILKLVQEAQDRKAPIHRLADRYSLVFTTVTIVLALAAWIISKDSVYALAVLVVATPCPLILATPIAIMSGIDIAARHGIIVKSGAAIEQLGEADIAVFDKTGTLTIGTPRVTTIELADRTLPEDQHAREEKRLLYYAAAVEQLSTHILAHAIVEAALDRTIMLTPATNFEETFGKGVSGLVPAFMDENERLTGIKNTNPPMAVAVGNRTFMQHLEVSISPELIAERAERTEQGQLCSFITLNGNVCGLIVMEDIPRPELARLSDALKKEGIKKTILLTGDSETVAQKIGQAAHMDQIIARCLPEDKVKVVSKLQAEQSNVLMVGDGINDAPALATASIGLALGSQGLTAAASAADAVLLSTDILRVVTAVHLGRAVMRIARQGIWIGMGLSGIAMLFAAFGYIAPAPGAILQEGIDVLVILNALRVGSIRRHLTEN